MLTQQLAAQSAIRRYDRDSQFRLSYMFDSDSRTLLNQIILPFMFMFMCCVQFLM